MRLFPPPEEDLYDPEVNSQSPSSVAMIGVPGEDLLRPVDLFCEHAAHHEVRPGQSAERQDKVGAPPHRVVQPVRAADQERDTGPPFIPPTAYPLGQIPARQIFPLLVQRNDDGGVWDLAQQ